VGRLLLPEILGQTDRVGAKSQCLAVSPSEKGQLTVIESPVRAFQSAIDEHHTLSLSPPQGGSKTQCPKFEQ